MSMVTHFTVHFGMEYQQLKGDAMTRDQFFEILKGLFHPQIFISPTDAAYSLINQNAAALAEMSKQIKTQEDKIFTWLGKFDSQQDDEGRQKIVNTVSMDVEIDPNMVALANPNNNKV